MKLINTILIVSVLVLETVSRHRNILHDEDSVSRFQRRGNEMDLRPNTTDTMTNGEEEEEEEDEEEEERDAEIAIRMAKEIEDEIELTRKSLTEMLNIQRNRESKHQLSDRKISDGQMSDTQISDEDSENYHNSKDSIGKTTLRRHHVKKVNNKSHNSKASRLRDPLVDGGGSSTNCRYRTETYHKSFKFRGYTYYKRFTRLVHICEIM